MLGRWSRPASTLRLIAVLAYSTVLFGCEGDPGYHGQPSSYWMSKLHDPSPAARIEGADALGEVLEINPHMSRVVDALVETLSDSDDAVRTAAGRALATTGVDDARAIPRMVSALHDSAHASMRSDAASILGDFGSRGIGALPALTEALRDADSRVRASAAEALGKIGPGAAGAIPALTDRTGDPVAHVRIKAIEAVMNMRTPASRAVPLFVLALDDSIVEVRMSAAYALGVLGSAALPATPRLVATLGDTSAALRAAAAFALGQIGPPARAIAEHALVIAVGDSDRTVATTAVTSLHSLRGEPTTQEHPREPTLQEKCRNQPVGSIGC